ncbi:MAG: AsmA-like C-terminal region-containing protein [Bacteroidota bacterium]
MKIVKNILKVLAVLVVLFLVAAIAIPVFYKDKIVATLKEETNKSVNAKVDFKDVELSLLRSFPAISLHIDDLTVDGINEFAGTRLFGAPAAELELDFWKVWGNTESIPVEAFILESPVVNIKVLKDGRANWDIAKPSETPENAEPINYLVEMEQYSIKNGQLTYVDESLDFDLVMDNLNHTGSGDFSESVFDLDTETTVDAITAEMDGVTYLRQAKANLDAIINMNINDLIFTLKDNVLNLNALTIKTDGMVDMNDEEYVMDLKFSSPQNDFKNLWSIIPSAYTADYDEVKIDGKMTLNGMVAGTYNGEKAIYPAFRINTIIDNGNVKYPDLPMGLQAIFADITVNSPSSNFDEMVVRIPQFEFKLGNNPFAGNFNLRTPVSDPKLKTEVRGTLNLADIQKAVPIEGMQNMAGIIKSDFYVNAAMSQMERAQYEQIDMRGDLEVSNIVVEQDGMPKVTIQSLKTDFSPQRIRFENFVAQLGQSDLRASGRILNVLAYFSPEKTMDGNFKMESNYFNANEWMTEATATTPKVGYLDKNESYSQEPKAVLTANDTPEPIFDRFNFNIDANVKKLDYDVYKMENFTFDGTVNPKRTVVDNFYTKIGESDIQASGSMNNLIGYALDNETLTGNIDLNSNYLDLNQFMTETEEEVPLEIIPIPENIDLTINSDLKKVRYTNFDLNNIRGDVVVKDSKAEMKNVKGKILGGDVYFDGAYNTQDLSKPKFDIKTSLNSLNFSKAFNTFNTFEKLAPIGKFIEGRFNTELSMNGILGSDMMPDLSSLNLSGFFHTLDGVINGFKPVQELANKLNLEEKVKQLKIRDSKNWIEVKNGFVSVREFEHKIDEMSFLISGQHGLTQEMEYVVKAKVPRALLQKTGVTAAANNAWDAIAKAANSKGINLANGEFVRLKIDLTGSITDPKFKIIPTAADGETSVQDATKAAVEATINKAKDSVRTVVDSTINTVKKEAESLKDTVASVVDQKVDAAKEQAKETAKSTAKSALDSLASGGKITLPKLDSLGKGGILKDTTLGKELDKAKDKLKDLLPFGKKKKKEEGN